MDVQLLVVVLCTLLELAASIGFVGSPSFFHPFLAASPVVIAYNRSTEIEKHCGSFLISASELEPDYPRGGKLENELSFYLGDWEQENDGPPLMQHDAEDVPAGSGQSLTSSPLKLASFEVKVVNSVQHHRNAVSLVGVLYLGISQSSSFGFGVDIKPHMNPTVMAILFEGVYMETKENGGEGLLCLLGNSTSTPSTDGSVCDEFPESCWYPYSKPQIRFLEDDHIFLVLRYPKTFKLTQRAIQGEMVSLSEKGGSKYFSKVYISSHQSGKMKYRFISELFESRNFDPSPYQAEVMEDGVLKFTGGEFCRVLDLVSREVLNISPNHNFDSRSLNMSQMHGKLGPFLLGKNTEDTSGLIHDDIKLLFQHVKCEEDTTSDATGSGIAKVSAVLRACPKGSNPRFEGLRAGLSGLTLTAEGIWNSSSGQLFMVGCEWRVDSGSEGCDYEIAMCFRSAISIKQRSFIFGSISSLKKDEGFDNPLLFNAKISPTEYVNSISWYLSYNYSMTKLVNAFQRRSLPYQLLAIVKHWLFQYPALKDAEEPLVQLSMLAGDLGLYGHVDHDQHQSWLIDEVLFQIEVLSLGPLLRWYNPNIGKRFLWNKPVITKEDLTSSLLFNVSMHLVFRTEIEQSQTTYKNVSELFLEGLYDPTLGEMHLIGCRKALVASIGIERGHEDCLIEVKIQYPGKNFQWKKNPSAKITISSQRQEDDPLYFSMINLDAFVADYRGYFDTFANPENFEGIFCILMLVGSIAFIWSQLLYMKVNGNIVPYISIFVLGFQILGYILPLIFGLEVLLISKDFEASYIPWHRNHPAPASRNSKFLEGIQIALLLVAALLSFILSHMVKKSLKETHPKGSPEGRFGAKKKQVFLNYIAIYMFGCGLLQVRKDMYPIMYMNSHQMWKAIQKECAYFVQDFFLLPQILSNLWKPASVKSLREAYYLGLTSIRLLVHFFDYIRCPDLHPEEDLLQGERSSPLFAKVAPPIAIIITAIILFIQQNFKFQKRTHSAK